MSPPSACQRSRWPLAAPLPLLVGSCLGKAARHAGWTEAALAGACTHLALTQLGECFADCCELEPDPRPASGAAGG
jgi:hypothetical protein